MEPFRMSDYGIFDPKDPMIDEVVKTIKLKYQKSGLKSYVLQIKISNKKSQF